MLSDDDKKRIEEEERFRIEARRKIEAEEQKNKNVESSKKINAALPIYCASCGAIILNVKNICPECGSAEFTNIKTGTNTPKNEINQIKTSGCASWPFAMFILFISLAAFPTEKITSVCFLSIALILMPPISSLIENKFISKKWGIKKTAIILVLFFIGFKNIPASDIINTDNNSPAKPAAKIQDKTVNAIVKQDGDYISVENQDNYTYNNVELSVKTANTLDFYYFKIGSIKPGEIKEFSLSNFVNLKGQRFNSNEYAYDTVMLNGDGITGGWGF